MTETAQTEMARQKSPVPVSTVLLLLQTYSSLPSKVCHVNA